MDILPKNCYFARVHHFVVYSPENITPSFWRTYEKTFSEGRGSSKPSRDFYTPL
jgi:hypothetical protein